MFGHLLSIVSCDVFFPGNSVWWRRGEGRPPRRLQRAEKRTAVKPTGWIQWQESSRLRWDDARVGKTNRPRVWRDTEGARNIVRGHSVQGKTRVYCDSERTLTWFLSLGPVLVFTLQHIVSPSKPWNSHYRPLGGSSYRQIRHSTAELCTFTALIRVCESKKSANIRKAAVNC